MTTDPLIGKTLDGRYEILEPIGSGAMGVVYRARQLSVDRDVAVKVLSTEAIQGALAKDAPERFEQEARIVSKLRHPNTVKLFDFGKTEDGRYYLVMELLTGQPLGEVLEGGPLGEERTLSVLRQVADSLAEAHQQGVVHRDLKPSNIFVDRIGEQEMVKVLDFGIAKSTGEPMQTATGAVFGTPAYMSPEQAQGDPVGPATDVYAMGVLAYHCLSGKPPFEGDTPVALLLKHVNEPPPPLPEDPGSSRQVEDLVMRILSKRPGDRPANAAEVRDSIRQTGSGVQADAAHPEQQRESLADRGRPRGVSRKLIAIAAAGLVGLAAVALLVSRFLSDDVEGGTKAEDEPPPIIAVLPFQATGSDDGGFLARGLHGDILTRLGKLKAFRVISQTSMMEYAGTTKNMRQIGEELGAGYIVEGGVQARGNRVHINAQLIEARTDEHVWAETYDRELSASDLFEVQAELAVAIATELHATLSPADRRVVHEIPTRNIDAYNAYLRGRELQVNQEGVNVDIFHLIVSAFKEAVRLDPDFALAWARLASAWVFMAFITDDGREAQKNLDRALVALGRARALQPDLMEAELAWAEYLFHGLNEKEQALGVLKALRKKNPGNAQTWKIMAFIHRRLGHSGDAYESMLAAQVLAPRETMVAAHLVIMAIWSDNCQAAKLHQRTARTFAPDNAMVRLAAACYELECTGDARKASDYFRGMEFADERQVWFAIQAALAERDYQRALELIDLPSPQPGPENSVLRVLSRSAVYRYMGRDSDVKAALDAAADAFNDIEREGVHDKRGWFAGAKHWYHALRNDADTTRQWVEEERRRREDEEVDQLFKVIHLFHRAVSLAVAGLHDEAIAELREMFEAPGGYGFRFVDALPDFDVLEDKPGYVELRERFGDAR